MRESSAKQFVGHSPSARRELSSGALGLAVAVLELQEAQQRTRRLMMPGGTAPTARERGKTARSLPMSALLNRGRPPTTDPGSRCTRMIYNIRSANPGEGKLTHGWVGLASFLVLQEVPDPPASQAMSPLRYSLFACLSRFWLHCLA